VRGELGTNSTLRVEFDGLRFDATVVVAGEKRHVFLQGRAWQLARIDPLFHGGEGGGHEGGLLAPMPGKVIALIADAGAQVEKGAPLLILEAMKMEHTILAPAAGTVKSYRFTVGDQVTDGAELVEFEPS
jgi:3-methylcrotonyl-CoA carboxylase alpha subunit